MPHTILWEAIITTQCNTQNERGAIPGRGACTIRAHSIAQDRPIFTLVTNRKKMYL